MGSTNFWCGILFSGIGFVFFSYGKRLSLLVPLCCGLVLMVYPYFVADTMVMVSVGTLLCAIPYFIRI